MQRRYVRTNLEKFVKRGAKRARIEDATLNDCANMTDYDVGPIVPMQLNHPAEEDNDENQVPELVQFEESTTAKNGRSLWWAGMLFLNSFSVK